MAWYVVLLMVVGILTVPFILGGYLSRKFRMPDHGWKMGLILCSIACGVVLVPPIGAPPKLGIDLSGGVILVYEVDQQKLPKDDSGKVIHPDMEALIGAISLRVNPGGQKEVTVREFGSEQIEIIIPINPDIDPEEAKRIEELVSRAGTLEFRILASSLRDNDIIQQAEKQGGTVVKIDDKVAGWWVPMRLGDKPEDRERVQGILSYPEIAQRMGRRDGQDVPEVLVLKDVFDVTGEYLTQASRGDDEHGQRCVNFTFNRQGGALFRGLTGNNLPDPAQPENTRKLGVILDGDLYSAPSIRSTISRNGQITGSFSKTEIKDLVEVLNAGSLPAALRKKPISKLVTGPRLGQDTIDKGRWAIAASMVLVLVFMLFYYRFAGIVACGALLINLLLIVAIMITVKAAFTLPGLAGLVLTVGIAVDANVLIFERIREELGKGAALRMAIRNGFGRATTTIVDANLTTLITGVVLYCIGTDQVRGFAVTLILGVTLSMYTAIFCSRVVFDVAEKRRWITKLSMMRILGKTQIDFLGRRRLATAVSCAVIAIGLSGVVWRGLQGPRLLDIDFTGGVSVEVVFKQPQRVAEIRAKLKDLPDLAVSDVRLEGEAEDLRFIVNTSKTDAEGNPAIEEVERDIKVAFFGLLDTNTMNAENVRPIAQKAVPAEPEASAEPEGEEQTRTDLPDDSVLAVAEEAPSGPEMAPAQPDAEPKTPVAEKSGDTTAAETPPPPDEEALPAAATQPPEAPPETSPETPPETSPVEPTEEAAVDPFAGGTEATLKFGKKISYKTLQGIFFTEFGSEDDTPLFAASSPDEGSQWDLKIDLAPEKAKPVFASIKKRLADTPYFPSSNSIGGKVAGDTQTKAVVALITSLLCIVAYLWIRFQKVVFGLAAVVALVHDVLVTLGVIALSAFVAPFLGFLLIDPFKIGLPALAAFLTIIGYSLNDTIVVFDRIREVRGKAPRLTEEMINTSINQTLARTLLTSATTLLVVLILFFFGGQGIHGFAFALVVGVCVGTYSSIFVASPALLWMSRTAKAK